MGATSFYTFPPSSLPSARPPLGEQPMQKEKDIQRDLVIKELNHDNKNNRNVCGDINAMQGTMG